MDVLATCLSGAVAKIYDDFTENGIIEEGLLKECLHTLSCFLLACSAMGDFTYGLMLYAVNISSHFGNENAFSEKKERSLLYLFPVIILLSLPSIKQLTILEIIVIILASPISFSESSTIKEEVSLRKLIMRLGCLAFVVIAIALNFWFEFFSPSLLKIFFFGLFYLIMSCIFQSYELFFKHFHIGIKIDESFFNNIMQYRASNKA